MAYLKKLLIPMSILVFLKMWNNKLVYLMDMKHSLTHLLTHSFTPYLLSISHIDLLISLCAMLSLVLELFHMPSPLPETFFLLPLVNAALFSVLSPIITSLGKLSKTFLTRPFPCYIALCSSPS